MGFGSCDLGWMSRLFNRDEPKMVDAGWGWSSFNRTR